MKRTIALMMFGILFISLASAITVTELSGGSFANVTFTGFQNQSQTLNLPSGMRYLTSGTMIIDDPNAFEELLDTYNYANPSVSDISADLEIGIGETNNIWQLGDYFASDDNSTFYTDLKTGSRTFLQTGLGDCSSGGTEACIGMAVNASNYFVLWDMGGAGTAKISVYDRSDGSFVANHSLGTMTDDGYGLALCEDDRFYVVEQNTLKIHIFDETFSHVTSWDALYNSNGAQDLGCYGDSLLLWDNAGIDEIIEYEYDGTFVRVYNSSNSIIFASGYERIGMNEERLIFANIASQAFREHRGFSAFANNPWLETGTPDGTREFYASGHYRDNITQINFTQTQLATINEWIAGNCAPTGACNVPFLFHSDDSGFLRYNNIAFSNDGFIENNLTFEATVTENTLTEFTINISYDNVTFPSPVITLNYNGTLYNGTTTDSGTTQVYNVSFISPEVNNPTDYEFYWSVALNSSDVYNSSFNNQTVQNLADFTLSASCGDLDEAIEFSLRDEENHTLIIGDVEYNFKYGITNSTANTINGELDDLNHFYLCVNGTQSDSYLLGYGELQYRTDTHIDRRYYLFEGQTISNNSLTNHTLYDLESAEQTSFLFEVTDTNLNDYEGIYTGLWRWYPDLDEYRIVDMGRTDEDGQTVGHVRTEDVDYRLGAYYANGSLIKLGDAVRFVCISAPCTFTLVVDSGDLDFTEFLNIESSLTFNETTSIFTYIYNDPSQQTESMALNVSRITGTDVLSICAEQSSGYTGVMTCNVSAYTGMIKAVAYRTASPAVPIAEQIINIGSQAFRSGVGLIVSGIIWLAIVLSAFSSATISPIIILILGVVGLIPAVMTGSINVAIFTGIIVLTAIVIHFIKRAMAR